MGFNMAKCERYVPFRLIVPLAHVKSIVLANLWLINNYVYVLLVNNGTFEVTKHCFTYFI